MPSPALAKSPCNSTSVMSPSVVPCPSLMFCSKYSSRNPSLLTCGIQSIRSLHNRRSYLYYRQPALAGGFPPALLLLLLPPPLKHPRQAKADGLVSQARADAGLGVQTKLPLWVGLQIQADLGADVAFGQGVAAQP